ncbi:MAG: hypothetical protein A2511_01075 [Deltaproteobacteria bacterium RIFOXYD12_FULL_50_9]|nr:MAG: hypothetical protein A2511_01075 [Deltaproteobacteria bacterium RIFOXYD12_FULL_50_9]
MIRLFKNPGHRLIRRYTSAILLLFSLVSAYVPAMATTSSKPDNLSRKLPALINRGGYIVTRDGLTISSKAPDTAFIPASTIKVATSLAALRILGDDYRFKTQFFSDSNGTLYIKGFGDPYLVSEEVALILDQLQAHGVTVINDIVIDDSAFLLPEEAPSWSDNTLNPYDAANNALAVNFNTMGIRVSSKGQVVSAEAQTPTLPLMRELGVTLSSGNQRINISKSTEHIYRYTAELFRALQKQKGITGHGMLRKATVPEKLTPVYTHLSSKPLNEVIRCMLAVSSNFIANQLFLTLGAKRFGYPATWEKGQMALREFYMEGLKLTDSVLYMEEGSGLSRRTHITPRAMLTILEAFKPYADLLRCYGDARLKTGTLTGAYAYAGFFSRGGSFDPFVILLNQQRNTRRQVLALLQEIYNAPSKETVALVIAPDRQALTQKSKTASSKNRRLAKQ